MFSCQRIENKVKASFAPRVNNIVFYPYWQDTYSLAVYPKGAFSFNEKVTSKEFS